MASRSRRPIFAAFLTFSTVLSASLAASGSESGLVRMIATGKAQGMPVCRAWVLTEPSIEGIIVPTRESGEVTASEIVRLMRIYFPRTFEDLVSYDFLLLAQIDMTFISPKQAQWMHDAIADHGLGGVNTRSVMSMNNWLSEPWAESILSSAFPNRPWAVIRSQYYHRPSGSLVVNDDESLPPVVRPFKSEIEQAFPSYAGLLTVPRLGSKIHTWLRTPLMEVGTPKPGYVPHIFEWKYERGITFTFMDMVYDNFWKTNVNRYAFDAIVNVIWHAAGRDLPTDAHKVHRLRVNLRYYRDEKSAVLSVFDFAEKFGANTAVAYRSLGELDERKAEADRLYLSGDFDESYAKLDRVIDDLKSLADRALKLKDQALIWVYVVEWLAVAGTSMVCGVILWVLMVQRALYKDTGVTRGEARPLR